MTKIKSIAIETSCRIGGVAFGVGEQMLALEPLGPSGRHAAELLAKLDEMLLAQKLRPADLDELYISVGPGSFTGLRVGVTVARTLGQVYPSLKIVAVPTAAAVAENLTTTPAGDWQNLGVLLAAKRATAGHKECSVHATLFSRDDAGLVSQVGQAIVAEPAEIIAGWPRPMLLTGEGLEYAGISEDDQIQQAPDDLRLPRVENVWKLGRRLAGEKIFTSYHELLPIYARRPEAVRLWDEKQNGK